MHICWAKTAKGACIISTQLNTALCVNLHVDRKHKLRILAPIAMVIEEDAWLQSVYIIVKVAINTV